MKFKISLNIKEGKYELLFHPNATIKLIRLFSGGHATMGKDFLELGKVYTRFTNIADDIVLESGLVNNLDYNLWFWIDVNSKKYFFSLPFESGEIKLKERDKDIPIIEKDYVIIKIFQKSKDIMGINFRTNKEYYFDHDVKGYSFPDENLLEMVNNHKNNKTIRAFYFIRKWFKSENWMAQFTLRCNPGKNNDNTNKI